MGFAFWNRLGWEDNILSLTAYRSVTDKFFDGLGTGESASSELTEMKVAFTVADGGQQIVVFDSNDTLNVGDFIKVPVN